MNQDEVYAQFARLAGLSIEAGAVWKGLCVAAALRIEGILREGADPEDPRAVLAAAGEAYYRYTLCQGGDAESVKIGDISVSKQSGGGGSDGARALREELLADAAELLLCGFAGLRQVTV